MVNELETLVGGTMLNQDLNEPCYFVVAQEQDQTGLDSYQWLSPWIDFGPMQ